MAKHRQNLSGRSKEAFDDEMKKLEEIKLINDRQSEFLTTEGRGIAAEADIQLGNSDEADLTEEELRRQRSGRIADTGLFL